MENEYNSFSYKVASSGQIDKNNPFSYKKMAKNLEYHFYLLKHCLVGY